MAADLSGIHLGNGGPKLVVIDEIGPLELDKSTGMIRSLLTLDGLASESGNGALQVVGARPDIAARLAARWPGSVTLRIEPGQAEQVANDIIRRLEW